MEERKIGEAIVKRFFEDFPHSRDIAIAGGRPFWHGCSARLEGVLCQN
ncbi:MAG: hypothetical protein SVE93_07605 [Candidatus Thermoplasmatota archaeon]|nr:hypothetical protein [Candidatus Thermoplasmatota archaeon]